MKSSARQQAALTAMPIDASALACPSCGYDLRGSFDGVETFTCPECGRTSSIPTLAAIAVDHAQARRRMWTRATIAILVLGMLSLARLTADLDGPDVVDLLFAVAMAIAGWRFSGRWSTVSTRTRLIYALVPPLLVLAEEATIDDRASQIVILSVAVIWYASFEVYFAFREHRGPFK
jgi:hypothetical protein